MTSSATSSLLVPIPVRYTLFVLCTLCLVVSFFFVLSNLIMRVEPNALLGSLDRQATVFRTCWPMASAHSFSAVVA